MAAETIFATSGGLATVSAICVSLSNSVTAAPVASSSSAKSLGVVLSANWATTEAVMAAAFFPEPSTTLATIPLTPVRSDV